MTQADRVPPPIQQDTDMRNEIRAKWGRFDNEEIAAFKSNDDLAAELQVKYKLNKTEAQRDVDVFAHGRQLMTPASP